ncbi:hypothetical protein D3C81_1839570 [compost metagenome]
MSSTPRFSGRLMASPRSLPVTFLLFQSKVRSTFLALPRPPRSKWYFCGSRVSLSRRRVLCSVRLAIIMEALKLRSQVPLAFLTRLRSAVPLMGSCFQSAV